LVKLIERRAAAILLATQVWLPPPTDINVTAEQMTPPAIEVERIADRILPLPSPQPSAILVLKN
jgi:hypothetical protein